MQLNMGEGKTRVILPLLVLALTRGGSGDVVKLNFVGELLGDAVGYLQGTLTGLFFQRMNHYDCMASHCINCWPWVHVNCASGAVMHRQSYGVVVPASAQQL